MGGNLRKIFDDLTNGKDVLTPETLDCNLPARLQQLSRKELEHAKVSQAGKSTVACGNGFATASRGSTMGEVMTALADHHTQATVPPSDARSFKAALRKKFS